MKKFLSAFLIICTLLCGNVFAMDDYSIVDLSDFSDVNIRFSEGVCAVQDTSTSRWGFVDVNKNWVIAPKFKSASYFRNGLCAVNTIDGESVLINRNGDVVLKRNEFNGNLDSDIFYVEKHDKYNILFDERSYCWVTLLDESFNVITQDDVGLRTFRTSTDVSPYGSKTLFWSENQGRVYNYKGIDITEKLTSENISVSVETTANDKYIIGQADNKIKCFDIYGNKIAEFNGNGKASLDGNFIVCNNKVHNISKNKTVFDVDNIDIEKIETYYSKYFTVKKKNGTSALYSAGGEMLVNFGNWDYIYPSSVSNNIVVAIGEKYGIADYEGNLLFPIEYGVNWYFVSRKNPMYYSQISNDGKYVMLTKNDNVFTIDLSNLNYYTSDKNSSFIIGNKYHKCKDKILDNNFNIVYADNSINFIGGGVKDNLKNGIMKQMYSTKPVKYGFLIFRDGGVKVDIDKTNLAFDVLPIIQNGRTLVPMRAIFEALGADVEWNGDTQTITAKNNDVTIQMQIGNNTLTKNGQSTQMDVSPQIIDGRTMVPVRAISDSFNVTVDWDGYTQTVSLFTN